MNKIVINKLKRTREELAAFLRAKREQLVPADVGLPSGNRRRTPGLRREEVAALAGVGLTWYTWLEQGRDIGVSAVFLDNLARVLKLDAAERRHLFLLAHERLPAEPGKTFCQVPPLVLRLMADLAPHPCYVRNLRWDVLAYNPPADQLFGFQRHSPAERNLLWMCFTDSQLRASLIDWETQAAQLLASFRRDYAHATKEADIQALISNLQKASPEFRQGWQQHDFQEPCREVSAFLVDRNELIFEHTAMTIDADRHLKLVVYVQQLQ